MNEREYQKMVDDAKREASQVLRDPTASPERKERVQAALDYYRR